MESPQLMEPTADRAHAMGAAATVRTAQVRVVPESGVTFRKNSSECVEIPHLR